MSDTITAETTLPFGKQLAANEKKTRDKAVSALRRYISSSPELSRVDLLKLWKGLFYCYWMSDKPLVQQDLSEKLGSLVLDIPADNAIPFLEAFWETHCSEWHGLDRIRLDKYYMLLRRVIFYSFLFLANHDWNEENVEEYTTMLLNGPLHPTDRKKPDSIRYHIFDVYFEELDKVMELQREQGEEVHLSMESIERPIQVAATESINKVVRTKAKATLAAWEEVKKAEEESGDQDMDEDEE
ncbi:hypothetical protein BDB00DRAFT_794361 [Zychaea mexicana]|uniref:uncharacterized protein n=1 Tax=Zychaea mexicana TaxID=64656 RepID=UPI0022FF19FD|nr:uncharacterized protein BDB00DRAFT_794361 [Zychaea mexicana]KAI9499530.1 hypothetical protein BDB00DRAFT_794361 [Zychaea mexicana]